VHGPGLRLPRRPRLVETALHVLLERVHKILVDQSKIEPRGIEVPSAPALHVPMIIVLGIAKRIEKSLVAAGSTDILRWACSRAFDAGRYFGGRSSATRFSRRTVCLQLSPKSYMYLKLVPGSREKSHSMTSRSSKVRASPAACSALACFASP
jgi:hypothetical protein